MPKEIAVIGAGPKGVAIAAKARAAQLAGVPDAPLVTLFERNQAGAAWCGLHGYTDGLQPLCTPAERDLGFPYERLSFGAPLAAAVAEQMQREFSWHAFCIAEGIDATSYHDWVLRGRKPPAHNDFVRYLDFATRRSRATVEVGTVHEIDYYARDSKWVVSWLDVDRNPAGRRSFDAVVVTGSGPPKDPLTGAVDPQFPHSYDAANFWSARDSIESYLKSMPDEPGSVVIVGAGGGAAAIANWFVRNHVPATVRIVGREPTLYARRASYFEDRLFTDEEAWTGLPLEAKATFLRRSTAGVVWERVLDAISKDNVNYICADAVEVVTRTSLVSSMPPQFALKSRPIADAEQQRIDAALAAAGVTGQIQSLPSFDFHDADVLVDARGFKPLAFLDDMGLAAPLRSRFGSLGVAELQQCVDESLQLVLPGLPAGLHVPALGVVKSPAAGNLMALGWLSNSVLSRYL